MSTVTMVLLSFGVGLICSPIVSGTRFPDSAYGIWSGIAVCCVGLVLPLVASLFRPASEEG